MDADELKAAVSGTEPLTFCREDLFSDACWAFGNESDLGWRGTYRQFRNTIARYVDTNPNNVAIVGSARFGFSLAPVADKALGAFRRPTEGEDDPSDLDVVIIHDELFEQVWSELRKAYYGGYQYVRRDHGRECFFKFVSLKTDVEYDTTYLNDTRKFLLGLGGEASKKHGISVDMNYRIYDRWESAEEYYSYSIGELQKVLP